MKFIITILFLLVYSSYSQFEELENENLFENTLIESEESEIFDDIEYYIVHPISLQNTNSLFLSRLPLINSEIAVRIVDLVQVQGINNYKALFDSLDLSQAQRYVLTNCTYFSQSRRSIPANLNVRIRTNYQFENVAGFEKSKFQGDKLNYYTKVSSNFNNMSGGILFDKDVGEPNYFDFISGYLSWDYSNFHIIVGDYSVEFGLGNILWRNFGFRKSPDVISPMRYEAKGILPYRSSIESNFFRGIAISNIYSLVKKSDLKFSLFVSKQFRHSTIDSIESLVTSLKNDGLFRTDLEISRKGNLEENILGSMIDYRIKNLQVSIAGFYYEYPFKLATQSSSVFKGKNGKNLSLFASYNLKNNYLRTEISRDAENYISAKLNYIVRENNYDFTVGLRSFPEFYRAQYGYIFGESSSASNEFGVYAGFDLKKFKNIKISIYADFYSTYGRTYYIPLNVSGVDLLSDFLYEINRDMLINLRFRYEIKNQLIELNNIKLIENIYRVSFRSDLKAKITDASYCRMRFEVVNRDRELNKAEEWGFAIFGEYKAEIFYNFSVGLRMSYYDTDSFNSAIWQYEYTMPGYAFNFPLYAHGMRFYLFTDYEINKFIRFWIKYSLLQKNNVKNISSGYNEIKGNKDNRLTVQLDFYF